MTHFAPYGHRGTHIGKTPRRDEVIFLLNVGMPRIFTCMGALLSIRVGDYISGIENIYKGLDESDFCLEVLLFITSFCLVVV